MNSSLQPGGDNSQQRAYQFIKDAILGFQLNPTQRLVASEVAFALGISRTPVREALSRLEQEGLVTRTGGWGYLVRGMNLKDVLELFKVREALEVEAVVEALPNIERPALENLGAILATASVNRRNAGKFVALNRGFHNGIAVAARNDLLLHMLESIGDRVQMIGAMTVHHHAQRMDEILAENRAILRALKKDDADAAKSAVRAHIGRGREHVVRILEHGTARFVSATVA